MKLQKIILGSLVAVAILTSCKKDDPASNNEIGILPEKFGIDVPNSISYETTTGKSASNNVEAWSGNDIYEHLGNFIHIGEESAQIVEDLITAIRMYGINRPMSFTYNSEEDNREKRMVVVDNPDFDGITWEHGFTVTDVAKENDADGGKAMQVFWNNNPVKGIAVIKPVNFDLKNNTVEHENSVFRIDYSASGDNTYDETMTVQISGLPTPPADTFAVDNLKMHVGKKGDLVEVYGNSNHPNAKFFTDDQGFNWAFVAAGYESKDIGVAEVGLPPSMSSETTREKILKQYSIDSVFSEQAREEYPNGGQLLEDLLEIILQNAEAPGYFDKNGFKTAGTAPSSEYMPLETSIEGLTPYKPKDIADLVVTFK